MRRRGVGLLHAVAFGLAGTLIGCLQILGFDEVDQSGPCGIDADCPATQVCGVGGHCEPPCSNDGDCPTELTCSASGPGGRGRCVPVHVGDESGASTPEASVSDEKVIEPSMPETSASDGSEEVADGPDDVSEAGDGGSCGAVCPQFSWCSENQCLDAQPHGFYSRGTGQAAAENDQEQAIKIRVNFCGYLTGAGFVVTEANPAISYRMAVYSDNGGSPSTLLGQTRVQTAVEDGANEAPLELLDGGTPPFLGCEDTSFFLWVAVVWNVNGIEFATEAGQTDVWVTTSESSDAIFNNGFDPSFPSPATPYETPMVQAEAYVVVAGVSNR